MAKYNIPGLRQQRNSWFWEPSATLKREGWTPLPLGRDEAAAIVKAQDRNAQVEAWRAAGRPAITKAGVIKTPRQVMTELRAPIVEGGRGITLARLIREYQIAGYPRADDQDTPIAPNSRRSYDSWFALLAAWGGDKPANLISEDSANKFIRAQVTGKSKASGFAVLAAAKRLYSFGRRNKRLGVVANPFGEVTFPRPEPRERLWDEDRTGGDYELFALAAAAVGRPELAVAVDLYLTLGQRTIDMVKVSADDWRPINGLDPWQVERLANPDGPDAGLVMGFHMRTKKTKALVTIPVAGARRRRIEAAIAHNAARPVPGRRPGRKQADLVAGAILVNEKTGTAWASATLQAAFGAVREHLVGVMGHEQFAGLQLRDLRRTCVVRMAEAGLQIPQIIAITGHTLKNATTILETYLPRNVYMAASAVVAMMDHDDRRDRQRRKGQVKLVHST